MNTISRDYWFSAAHQIEGHPKCGRMHGHNYKVTVTLVGNINPETGMILDFGDLDKLVKPLIDAFDHRYILSRQNIDAVNPLVPPLVSLGYVTEVCVEASTAENLSQYLADTIAAQISVNAVHVTVWETHRSKASATHDCA